MKGLLGLPGLVQPSFQAVVRQLEASGGSPYHQVNVFLLGSSSACSVLATVPGSNKDRCMSPGTRIFHLGHSGELCESLESSFVATWTAVVGLGTELVHLFGFQAG